MDLVKGKTGSAYENIVKTLLNGTKEVDKKIE
jgi:hypothetical protein